MPEPKPTSVAHPQQSPDEAARASYLDDEFAEDAPAPSAPEPKPQPKTEPKPTGAAAVPPSATPAPVAETLPAAAPGHSKVYRRLAERLGYEPAEIDAMTPRELQLVADAASRHNAGPSAPESRRQEQPAPVPQRQPEPQPEPEPELDFGEDEVDGVLRKLSEKDYDKGIVRVLKTLAKENAELKRQIHGIAGHLHAQEAAKLYDRIDQLFTERAEVFGKGARHELDAESPEVAKRKAVVQHMDHLLEADKRLGTRSTFEQRFERAVQALFGSVPKAVREGEPADVAPTPTAPTQPKPGRPRDPATGLFLSDAEIERQRREEAWVRAGVAQPTQREADQLPHGDKRALASIKRHPVLNGQHESTVAADEYSDDDDV